MKSEEPIATLISSLEAATQQAIAVNNAFPDTVAKVIDGIGLRYHSSSLNECCDKAEFSWHWHNLNILPYTELTYEANGIAKIVKVHTEPYSIGVAERVKTKVNVKDYESILIDLKFNKHIIRLTDIHIAYGIINDKWDVDRSQLSDKVKLFLVFS